MSAGDAIAGGGGLGTGLDRVRLLHRALPERPLDAVALRTVLLGRTLEAPLLVSAVSGPDVAQAELAAAAAAHGVGLVAAAGAPAAARPPLLLVELPGVELRDREAPWRARDLVDAQDADGIFVRLDPLAQALRPDGDTRFDGVLAGIRATVEVLAPRIVIAGESGFGLDFRDVAALREAGVGAVDVGGAERASPAAAPFADWGLPTADAITDARAAAPDLPVIASGGIRDGVAAAKCLALGAVAVGVAPALLRSADGRAGPAVGALIEQLQIATWLAGAGHSAELGGEHLR